MILIIELILWIAGFAVSMNIYKTLEKLCNENEGALDEEYISVIRTQNATTKKHFFITGIYFPIAIILSYIVPITPFRWIMFFGCAFTLPPVVYDVLENNLKHTFESKERFMLSAISIYNLAIMALTMFTHYFAYMHVDFT